MDINIKDLSEEQREDLEQQLEEYKEENKTVWDLKEWDEYCRIDGEGDVSCGPRDDYWADRDRLNIWNVFVTAEEAKKEVEKRKAIVKVNKKIDELNDGWTPDWEDNKEPMRNIYYDFDNKAYWIARNKSISKSLSLNYIKSRNDAKYIIENMEEELNIIFNI